MAAPIVSRPGSYLCRCGPWKILTAEAETAYAAYGWEGSRPRKHYVVWTLNPVKVRTGDIIEGSKRLADLFETLSTRELVHNLERIHP